MNQIPEQQDSKSASSGRKARRYERSTTSSNRDDLPGARPRSKSADTHSQGIVIAADSGAPHEPIIDGFHSMVVTHSQGVTRIGGNKNPFYVSLVKRILAENQRSSNEPLTENQQLLTSTNMTNPDQSNCSLQVVSHQTDSLMTRNNPVSRDSSQQGGQNSRNQRDSRKSSGRKSSGSVSGANQGGCRPDGDSNRGGNGPRRDDDDHPCRRFNPNLYSANTNQTNTGSGNNRRSNRRSGGGGGGGGAGGQSKGNTRNEYMADVQLFDDDNNDDDYDEDVFIDNTEPIANRADMPRLSDSIDVIRESGPYRDQEVNGAQQQLALRNELIDETQSALLIDHGGDENEDEDDMLNNLRSGPGRNSTSNNNAVNNNCGNGTLDVTQPVADRHALLLSSATRRERSSTSSTSSSSSSSSGCCSNSLKNGKLYESFTIFYSFSRVFDF
jgi:hypothetical protein